jgi:hypothetical protein
MSKRASESNNLEFCFSGLMSEWNWDKNSVHPSSICPNYSKNVYWICNKGHEWMATPNSRVGKRTSCPFCSGNIVDYNGSFGFLHANLLNEWDFVKNHEDPYKMAPRSGKKVWWKCNNGHSWTACLGHRVNNNSGCPYCSHNLADKDNNIKVLLPELMKEWDISNSIDPYLVLPNSSLKVKWICCKCGNKWSAVVSTRAGRGDGCPKCSKIVLKNGGVCSSKIECFYYIILFDSGVEFYYNKRYPDLMLRYDFYIPSLNLYIETTTMREETIRIRRCSLYWKEYYKKILRKQDYVSSIGANFLFINRFLKKYELDMVKENILYGK